MMALRDIQKMFEETTEKKQENMISKAMALKKTDSSHTNTENSSHLEIK